MTHLTQTDLHRIYKGETGNSAEDWDDGCNSIQTNEYFNWLEIKLLHKLNDEIELKKLMDEFNSESGRLQYEEMEVNA